MRRRRRNRLGQQKAQVVSRQKHQNLRKAEWSQVQKESRTDEGEVASPERAAGKEAAPRRALERGQPGPSSASEAPQARQRRPGGRGAGQEGSSTRPPRGPRIRNEPAAKRSRDEEGIRKRPEGRFALVAAEEENWYREAEEVER